MKKRGIRMKKLTKKITKKDEATELKLEMSRLKRESNAMIKKLDLRLRAKKKTFGKKERKLKN